MTAALSSRPKPAVLVRTLPETVAAATGQREYERHDSDYTQNLIFQHELSQRASSSGPNLSNRPPSGATLWARTVSSV